MEVQVGIEGHYRAGRWTALRVVGDGATSANCTEIETRDGDGVRVIYRQSTPLAAGGWGYVVPGTEAAPLIVRGEQDQLLSTRFPALGSPSRGASMIPLKMPWIVIIGDPMNIDQIGANDLLDRDSLVAASMPQTAAGFPDSVLGYDGVDMMVINGSGTELLASLSAAQRAAIAGWLTSGGHLFLSLGKSAPELFQAAPWLLEYLPLQADPIQMIKLDPSALETYISSTTPLERFEGVQLPKRGGRILITGRTTRRISTPFAAEYIAGLGRITVINADLDNAMFQQWPERLDLITRLTGSILIPRKEESSATTRATAYDDLAGQLRVNLDQFSIKRPFGFSLLSLILMGLIAAVGPLDYLVVNRVFGRPLLGWFSFPLMAIGLSVLLAYQALPMAAHSGPVSARSGKAAHWETSGPDQQIRCNRMEFVDIDAIAGKGRGYSVSYLYSHRALRTDVDVRSSDSLASMAGQVNPMLTAPFGYPGESFGGIQMAIEDARLPTYLFAASADNLNGLRGNLRGLPLAPRSSKSLATRFWFEPQLPTLAMSRRPGSQLLQGGLTNPFPFDLLDGMLVYGNWVYLLPSRFPSGDQIATLEDLRQKNFRWQLSRQKALEENTAENEQWDPAARG
ncbi:MAG: hypothetical protein MI861_19125, partial [Pirellulales bacterium]|nr:hypothetical protein [Pirellulales bacterium]